MIKLYKFYTPYCGACKLVENYISDLKKEDWFKGVEYISIDIEKEENSSFIDVFKLIKVPTLIIERDNLIMWQANGIISKNDLRERLKLFLE